MRAFSRVGTILHAAHAQDFERRRRPELGRDESGVMDEDDEDDHDDTSDEEAEDEVQRHRNNHRQQSHKQSGDRDGGEGGSDGELSPGPDDGEGYSAVDRQNIKDVAAVHDALGIVRGNDQ